MASPRKYRPQDPVINPVLSGGGEPLILHIYCFVDHVYNICSGDRTLKLLAQSDLQSQSGSSLIIYECKHGTLNHELVHCQFTDKPRLNDVGFVRGPSDQTSAIWWSDVHQNTPISIEYRLTAAIHFPPQAIRASSNATRMRVFIWKNQSRLMLVDEETDTVSSIFDDVTMDSTKCGTLQILVPFDDNFNLTTLTSPLTIHEKLKVDSRC
jgi:hypothetical protein